MKKSHEYLLLFLILITGAVLRFYNLGEISLSNDELSAITRARYDTFGEMLEKGVKTDGHPALVETLIWFIVHQINDEVITIRFPFALSGIISIFLIYLLGRRWFGVMAGLLSAAALATLQFPLLYSQIARPYSMGLMFALAAAYLWTRILFDHKRTFVISAVYVLSMSACMYTHYFSFMLAGIMGVSGLFLLNRSSLRPYLLMHLAILLLYIPHLPLFQAQFAYGGIGGWLPKPDSSFLPLFLYYGLNESYLVIIPLAGLLVFSIAFQFRDLQWKKFHTLCMVWLLLPFLIGFCYSIWKDAVLQFSTLLFSFPFLILVAFSFISDDLTKKKISVILVLLVLSIGVYSTVFEKKYYQTMHFGTFKDLADKTRIWDEQFGKEIIVRSFTLSNPEYLNYYFRKLGHQPGLTLYPDNEREQYGALTMLCDTTRASYFIYGWTNISHFYETTKIIMEKFPVMVERDSFFNSEIILFKKGNNTNPEKIIYEDGFEKNEGEKDFVKLNHDLALSGNCSQQMDSVTEYSVTYTSASQNLSVSIAELLQAEVYYYSNDSVHDASLVIAYLKDNEMLSYSNIHFSNFYSGKGKWTKVFLYSEIPSVPCEVRIYVWNPRFERFVIDNLKVSASPKLPF